MALTETEKTVLKEMADFEKQYSSVFAVDEATGEFLHDLVLKSDSNNILELGTWRGASAIYMASALKQLREGKIVTVDVGNDRVGQARENIKKAGLSDYINQVIANIDDYLPTDSNKYDLIFMDAQKDKQLGWLKQILEKNVKSGTIILVDDIISMGKKQQDLIEFVKKQKLDAITHPIDDGILEIKIS